MSLANPPEVGELEDCLQHIVELVIQMDDSVRRAEIATAVAEASIPEPMVSFTDLFAEPEATWTIIIASERNLVDAQKASEIATKKGYTVAIYKVGDYYSATADKYRYKQEAESNLPEIRASTRTRSYRNSPARRGPG